MSGDLAWYTIAEVADLLGLTNDEVHARALHGELHYSRTDRGWRFSLNDLKAHIARTARQARSNESPPPRAA